MNNFEDKTGRKLAANSGLQLTPAETSQVPEEPVALNKLFPNAHQDLDALFPNSDMKKFLKEIVECRKKNERFVKRIKADVETNDGESE